MDGVHNFVELMFFGIPSGCVFERQACFGVSAPLQTGYYRLRSLRDQDDKSFETTDAAMGHTGAAIRRRPQTSRFQRQIPLPALRAMPRQSMRTHRSLFTRSPLGRDHPHTSAMAARSAFRHRTLTSLPQDRDDESSHLASAIVVVELGLQTPVVQPVAAQRV